MKHGDKIESRTASIACVGNPTYHDELVPFTISNNTIAVYDGRYELGPQGTLWSGDFSSASISCSP